MNEMNETNEIANFCDLGLHCTKKKCSKIEPQLN